MTVKQQLVKLVDELPEDCTMDDAHYRMFVLEKVAKGDAQHERGETIPHEQVKARLQAKWGSE